MIFPSQDSPQSSTQSREFGNTSMAGLSNMPETPNYGRRVKHLFAYTPSNLNRSVHNF